MTQRPGFGLARCTCGQPRRRRLLGGALALAGAAALPAMREVRGADTPGAGASAHTIDIHHHLLPPAYIAASSAARTGERAPAWTIERSLEEMDRNRIRTAVVSLTQPGVWIGQAAQPRRLAREANEYAARMAADHRGRFGSFAAIPLPDIEGSLREIEYAFDTLKAEGIGLMTSYENRWLGDPAFWPVMEELNRRKAVIYTHPLGNDCCKAIQPEFSASTIEYATDTTRTIGSLLFQGTAARYPDIRWIFSHGGGTMPFLLSRFERVEATMKARAERLPRGLHHELRKFWYDTAQANHPGALDALLRIVPVSQVLFGSDFPFRPASEEVEALSARGLSNADRLAIEAGNALRLMPSLAPRG
jgi:predicted TIM-barrel fold metal-dependent hydrolase